MPSEKARSIVYIDGLNLYYGAVKGTQYKWLNLEELCRRLRKDDEIVCVRYFTSPVHGPAGERQAAFLHALSTFQLVKTVLGKFKSKSVECTHPKCKYEGNRFFEGLEEKRTDVNIAVYMLDDAQQDRCDKFVLISGDSDLVPAIQMIKTRFPQKKIIVYVPDRSEEEDRRASELQQIAHMGRKLPLALLPHCQLPDQLTDRDGRVIRKPATW